MQKGCVTKGLTPVTVELFQVQACFPYYKTNCRKLSWQKNMLGWDSVHLQSEPSKCVLPMCLQGFIAAALLHKLHLGRSWRQLST